MRSGWDATRLRDNSGRRRGVRAASDTEAARAREGQASAAVEEAMIVLSIFEAALLVAIAVLVGRFALRPPRRPDHER
jgi:hypothetical protein